MQSRCCILIQAGSLGKRLCEFSAASAEFRRKITGGDWQAVEVAGRPAA